jgi:hypothetical protein
MARHPTGSRATRSIFSKTRISLGRARRRSCATSPSPKASAATDHSSAPRSRRRSNSPSALAAAGLPVTLETAYDLLTSAPLLEEIMLMVVEKAAPSEAEQLLDYYLTNFLAQPPEQLGGVKTTVANY